MLNLNLKSNSLQSSSSISILFFIVITVCVPLFFFFLLLTTEAKDKVECGLFLNVIVSKSTAILKLLASKDEALLVRRDALLVLDLLLDIVNRIARLNLKGDGLTSKSLYKDLHDDNVFFVVAFFLVFIILLFNCC